jgi:hypothetical protein
MHGAQMMTLAGGQPGDARGASVTLGGATITGGTPWNGTWTTLPAAEHRGQIGPHLPGDYGAGRRVAARRPQNTDPRRQERLPQHADGAC